MSKKHNLTPWFPGHIKPVRPGVYQTRYRGSTDGYSYWTGKRWSNQCLDIEFCHSHGDDWTYGAVQRKEWRGLAEDPQGGKA